MLRPLSAEDFPSLVPSKSKVSGGQPVAPPVFICRGKYLPRPKTIAVVPAAARETVSEGKGEIKASIAPAAVSLSSTLLTRPSETKNISFLELLKSHTPLYGASLEIMERYIKTVHDAGGRVYLKGPYALIVIMEKLKANMPFRLQDFDIEVFCATSKIEEQVKSALRLSPLLFEFDDKNFAKGYTACRPRLLDTLEIDSMLADPSHVSVEPFPWMGLRLEVTREGEIMCPDKFKALYDTICEQIRAGYFPIDLDKINDSQGFVRRFLKYYSQVASSYPVPQAIIDKLFFQEEALRDYFTHTTPYERAKEINMIMELGMPHKPNSDLEFKLTIFLFSALLYQYPEVLVAWKAREHKGEERDNFLKRQAAQFYIALRKLYKLDRKPSVVEVEAFIGDYFLKLKPAFKPMFYNGRFHKKSTIVQSEPPASAVSPAAP